MELTVRGVHLAYPDRPAVSGVDLTARPGQVVAIVGPNGCGKSTLLRGIARLHRPSLGTITVGGADIWRLRPRSAAQRVALLPQSPQSPEGLTVAGLVRYGRHPHQGLFRQWSPEDARIAEQALTVAGVADLADRRVDELSGGQRQRCWLAMVVAQQAPVLLLDEPTSALDLGHQVQVLQLIRDLADAGHSIVTVLHDLSAAARWADVIVAMHTGAVVAAGPPRDVINADLVRSLYGIDADVLAAPQDGAPVIVPATGSIQRRR
ncbi:MAG TPA: ABC transporter ATP-binding protein [Micromonosporaceae bacterium]|nr:ABC transporter ATP-binding protein [Micromonosporaceae bacterium]